MAKKPRSEWSPAYRKRVERAEARGKSRQQARGHKPREHASRRVNKGLPPPAPRKAPSTPQGWRKAITDYAKRQYERQAEDSRPDWGEWRAGFLEHYQGDHTAFLRDRGFVMSAHRHYKQRGHKVLADINWLEAEASAHDVPDTGWLFYH